MRRRLILSRAIMRAAMDRRAHPPTATSLPRRRTAPTALPLVGVGLVAALIAIAGVAALAALVSPLLAVFVACSVAFVTLLVVGTCREDLALRRFRRDLAALPETVHPLGY
jgi:hypothetical protein